MKSITTKALFLATICLCAYIAPVAAQTKIGGALGPADSSALLQLGDTTGSNKGLLVSHVSLTAATVWGLAGSKPIKGMVVYNTATAGTAPNDVVPGIYYWNGTKWVTPGATAGWLLTGNTGTDTTLDFIGTTDNKALMFRINDTYAGMLATNNTVLGYQALHPGGFIPGSENTAIGTGALNAGAGLNDNTAVGYNALNKTIASANTAVGSLALANNTTGGWNSALGYLALLDNTTGMHSNAFGSGALNLNTSGSENTAIGFNALTDNTTGSYNTALGNVALSANTLGNRNTAIGYGAGSAVTTGSSNILLGASDTVANRVQTSSPTASNELNIGNTLFGTGVNHPAGSQLGKIGINTNNPLATLHVKGTARIDSLPKGAITDSVVTADASGNLRKVANMKIMNVAYVAPTAITTYSTDTLDMIMVNPNADNIATVNLPASTTRVVGTVITVKNAAAAGTNVLTIKSQGSDTIDDPTGTNNTFGPVGGGASVQFVLTDTGTKKVWFSIADR